MSEENRDVKVNHTRMKSAEYVRTLWVVTTEQGVTRKDIQKPEFWSHVAAQFRPYDRIEVRCDDGTYFAEYLILSCERTYAVVKELSWVSLTTQDVAMTQNKALSEYEYRYRGPHGMHSILRKSDGAVMVEKLESKAQAIAWLDNHMKVIAA